ncbi:hypothetical protein V6N13_027951 [Hibiscus sabdariffa]
MEELSGVSEDLTYSIACKLHDTSLIRFQSVAKSFAMMVSDPLFIKFHLERGTISAESIFLHSLTLASDSRFQILSLPSVFGVDALMKEIECPSIRLYFPCKIMEGTYHGLVCMSNKESDLVVLNTTLRSHTTVPPRYEF